MSAASLRAHVAALHACRKCPRMESAPVSGGPVASEVVLVGQAPGTREPVLGRPFAWTAGKTLFRWFEEACGFGEEVFRANIYMAAVCRCFPGKHPKGSGDRVSLLNSGSMIPIPTLLRHRLFPVHRLACLVSLCPKIQNQVYHLTTSLRALFFSQDTS